MNNLCADIGYKSVYHHGEELCGDHVDIIEQEKATVVVLADGLGSGVKASILSTLTAKIISTMIAEGLSIEDCVETIVATLPVCSVRGLAYSTFTIIHINNYEVAEIIQYDNPPVILIRDEKNYEYPVVEVTIGGKKVCKSTIPLQAGDMFVAMSDGCPHAGANNTYNMKWKQEDIVSFIEMLVPIGYTAKTLSTMLVEECNKLYDYKPTDDATACIVRIRKKEPMNLLFGPPESRDDCHRMLSLFFSKKGKHIVCGGTTSSLVANYLGKEIRIQTKTGTKEIPPTSKIKGVDLVTEGVVTIHKVAFYAKDYLADNVEYEHWSTQHDGASLICRLLFEEATDITFYIGKAINPAHQNPDLPIDFNIKMHLVKELSENLEKMGKRVKVNYF